MDHSSEHPAVVMDESPHEFYAGLLGKRPKAVKSSKPADIDRNKNTTTTRRTTLRMQQSLPIVPPEQEPQRQKKDAAFNQTYRRALSDPPKLSALTLDESNKGYKMLARLGWKEEEGGLGRKRQGALTPVKTRFKKDKRGVGLDKKEARVTHQPHRPAEAAATKAKETKAERRRRRKREREKEQHREKRARMLLRTDVSDEYEQLYMGLHHGG